jgi:hypothetical protein
VEVQEEAVEVLVGVEEVLGLDCLNLERDTKNAEPAKIKIESKNIN